MHMLYSYSISLSLLQSKICLCFITYNPAHTYIALKDQQAGAQVQTSTHKFVLWSSCENYAWSMHDTTHTDEEWGSKALQICMSYMSNMSLSYETDKDRAWYPFAMIYAHVLLLIITMNDSKISKIVTKIEKVRDSLPCDLAQMQSAYWGEWWLLSCLWNHFRSWRPFKFKLLLLTHHVGKFKFVDLTQLSWSVVLSEVMSLKGWSQAY